VNVKQDIRVKMTKALLHKSILELLRENPISKITVKEICARAGINRATFYSHYADTFSLMDEIKSHIIQIVVDSVHKAIEQHTLSAFRINLCRLIAQNIEYFEYACGQYCEVAFQKQIIDTSHKYTLTLWKNEFPKAKDEELNLVHTYISSGYAAVIISWVQDGMRRSPEDLDCFFERVSRRTLSILKD
jgi:AcrR family transcriptional regulator